jgi:predicted nucleic acid-binding protein
MIVHDANFSRLRAAQRGILVTDAQIAALAISHKATIHTADRDLLRFKSVRCKFPLDD